MTNDTPRLPTGEPPSEATGAPSAGAPPALSDPVARCLRRLAAEHLGLPPEADAAAARRALLRRLPADDFTPPPDLRWAAHVLADRPLPEPVRVTLVDEATLAAEAEGRAVLDAFGREFFALPGGDRLERWDNLRREWEFSPALRARLAALRPGLPVPHLPAPESDPAVAELAKLVAELFVLPPTARSDRQAALLKELEPLPIEQQSRAAHSRLVKAAEALEDDYPQIPALVPTFLERLRSSYYAAQNQVPVGLSFKMSGGMIAVLVMVAGISLPVLLHLGGSYERNHKVDLERRLREYDRKPEVDLEQLVRETVARWDELERQLEETKGQPDRAPSPELGRTTRSIVQDAVEARLRRRQGLTEAQVQSLLRKWRDDPTAQLPAEIWTSKARQPGNTVLDQLIDRWIDRQLAREAAGPTPGAPSPGATSSPGAAPATGAPPAPRVPGAPPAPEPSRPRVPGPPDPRPRPPAVGPPDPHRPGVAAAPSPSVPTPGPRRP